MIRLIFEHIIFNPRGIYNNVFNQSFLKLHFSPTCFRCLSSISYNSNTSDYKNKFPYYTNVRFKGHSKWQNIASTKRANDMRKSRIFSKIVIQVRNAVKEGGPDIKLNSKLAALWEKARVNNMPATTFNRAIDRALNIQMKPCLVEVVGPSGFFMVIEGEVESTNFFINSIKKLIRKTKFPAKVVEGRIQHNFDVKGLITLSSTKDGKPIDLDMATDIAIEAGAEDVEEGENEDNQKEIRIILDPENLEKAKTIIEKANYNLDMADVVYTPYERVTLEPADLELLKVFFQSLEENEEVQRTHHNVEGLES